MTGVNKALLTVSALCFMGMLLTTPVAFGSGQPPDVSSATIIHEKDLRVDPKTGYGAFAWRSDSKALAYVKFLSGHIGVIDVESGEEREIPNFQMNGATALVWSQDTTMIALSSGSELSIVRVSDGQVVGYHAAYKEPQGSPRMGHAMAFVDHDSKLVIENPSTGRFGADINGVNLSDLAAARQILLTVYDIATRTLSPAFTAAYDPDLKNLFPLPNSGGFYRSGSKLFYTFMWKRDRDRSVDPPDIDPVKDHQRLGSETFFFVVNRPSTCVIVDLSDGLDRPKVRSKDFPPPGEETLDGSRDIAEGVPCWFSITSDRFVVIKPPPIAWDADPRTEIHKWALTHVESYQVNSWDRVIALTPPPEWPDGLMVGEAVHPTRPWALSSSLPGSDGRRFLMLADLTSGQIIGQTVKELRQHVVKFFLSPDGNRIAGQAVGYEIPIYKILLMEPRQ